MDDQMVENMLQTYHINLMEVFRSKEWTQATKLLAAKLMDNPYYSVGMFMQTITDTELEYFQEISERHDCDELVLLTLMLLHAEGTDVKNELEFEQHFSSFKMFLAGTALERKGMIKVNYENFSFNQDAGDKIVFERIEE